MEQEADRRIDDAVAAGGSTLNLRGLRLTEVPERVASLTGLRTLDLGANRLRILPSQLADLPLRHLRVDGNRLRTVPELPGLTRLDLHDNYLAELPSWLAGLDGLTELRIGDNQLTGVPDWLGRLTGLTWLGLGGCGLRELPAWVTVLPQLRRLDLHDNRLHELPEFTGLTRLHVNGNRLTEVPDWLTRCTSLTDLNLGDNHIRHIPDQLANLTHLTALGLSHCHLTSVPPWLATLPQLSLLDLSDNHLISLPIALPGLRTLLVSNNPLGALPDWLPPGLTELDAARCELTTLPHLPALTRLNVTDNDLTELPAWLGDLNDLTCLEVRGNALTQLPDLSGCGALEELYIGMNHLVDLPDWLPGLSGLSALDIARCGLVELPELRSDLEFLDISYNELTALRDHFPALTQLYMSGNRLSELPSWLADRTDLTHLDVNMNNIGTLPDWLFQLTSLCRLHVGHNKLTGLSDGFRKLTRLTTLDIGDCGLTKVPTWLVAFTNLRYLYLRDNRLTDVPEWLADLSDLTALWLNGNELAALPNRLGDMTGLIELSLSVNQFTTLPDALSRLSNLETLLVERNELSSLPTWLGTLSDLTTLDISACRLSVLPNWLRSLPRLRSLVVSRNEITELPDWLAELTGLRALFVWGNPLGVVNPVIGELSELRSLDLSDCWLTTLPDSLARLAKLSRLYVSENNLGEVADWISDLDRLEHLWLEQLRLTELPDSIGKLRRLRSMSLSGNGLTALPETIGELSRLTVLRINDNRLGTLPNAVTRLTRLTTVSLVDNELSALPGEFGHLSRLTDLRLSGNQLAELPESLGELRRLERLTLVGNRLRTLPGWLAELPALTDLTVAGNPLVSPPPEITGSEAVLAFLRDLRQGGTAQWLSKLLVVGEGGVGKTSLVRALSDEAHDPEEPSTHGLTITELSLDHPGRPDVAMRLSTWDFGGQEIYHATHQFFLTDRSLFVLLWNSRLGWEQGRLRYWLDIITARAPESPIVLVATHIGDRPADLPLTELRADYPRIVASVRVDNAGRDGIDELRTLLAEQAAGLPLMGSEWPTAWLAAADSVRALPEKHVSPARMWQTMAAAGVTEPQQQRFIARALHELGDILFYAEDPELDQIVVLRPAWVNDYISRVLDSDQVTRERGLLTREHLDVLWHDLDRGVRDHFLGMMDRYDLSYRIDGNRSGDLSLVVERLQWDPPSYQDTWAAAAGQREIRVIYRLNTMPPGIPTWFIARSHRFSTGLHWRSGALLAHRDQRHLALVRADRHRGTVELAVRGPAPASFFMVLDDGLNLTLERFPGLEITRQVPCACEEGCPELFDYDNLNARLARTPPREEIECHRSGERVSVPELLLGLAPAERESTRAAVEQLTRALERLGERLDQQGDYAQRMFLRLQRLLQQQQEARCPSVFTVVPADRRRVTGTAYEIHLYCEEPGAWHRLPDGQGVYPITQPHEWFARLGPYLGHLITILKHAAPLAGPVLGAAVGILHEQLKSDVDLMKELAGQLPAEPSHARRITGADPAADGPEAHAATDADFRALRAMLAALDPGETWGGLSRFTTPEGLTLYLCGHHLAHYR